MMGKMVKNMTYFVVLLIVVLLSFGVTRQAILNPNAEPKFRIIRDVCILYKYHIFIYYIYIYIYVYIYIIFLLLLILFFSILYNIFLFFYSTDIYGTIFYVIWRSICRQHRS